MTILTQICVVVSPPPIFTSFAVLIELANVAPLLKQQVFFLSSQREKPEVDGLFEQRSSKSWFVQNEEGGDARHVCSGGSRLLVFGRVVWAGFAYSARNGARHS